MAEEPEQVLPQERIAAARGIVEAGGHGLVKQQHDRAGDQGPRGGHEDDAGQDDHPDQDRDVVHFHARRAAVHRGDGEVDAAQQERDEFQRDREQPQRRADRRQVIGAAGGKRGIGGPGAAKRAALDQKRSEKNESAQQENLIRKAIDSRKRHVVAADHQRDQEISECGDEHGHGHPENHDAAVHGDQRVVLARRNDPVPGNMLIGKAQLHAEDVREIAADHGHRHAGEQILHGDDLVVGGPEVFLKKSRLGVLNFRAHRRTSAIVAGPSVADAGIAGCSATAGLELRISQAAWSCGVSTIIRPAISAWPMPHICVH